MSLLLLLVLAYVVHKLWSLRARHLPRVPRSNGTVWFGDLFYFWTAMHSERLLFKLVDIFQGARNMTVGLPLSKPALLTCDPETVEHILKTRFLVYGKGPAFHRIFKELLGDGIFNTDGQVWSTQRKLAVQIFSSQKLQTTIKNIFMRHSLRLVERLASACKQGEWVDLQSCFFDTTFHSICEIAFSSEIRSEDTVEFCRAFDVASTCCQKRFLNPFWKYVKRGVTIGLFPKSSERQLMDAITDIDAFAYGVIRERKERLLQDCDNIETNHDLLSLFLSQGCFTDAYLRDLLLNFVIAGRDSSAQTLSWMCFLLFRNKEEVQGCHDIEYREHRNQSEILRRLYDAVDDFYVEHNIEGDEAILQEAFGRVREIAYLQAVIFETLRLFPPVPKDAKFACQDDYIPHLNVTIPRGSPVVYCAYTMGRREDIWTDAHIFDPDRWIDDAGQFHEASPYRFVAFQAGTRTCLGKMVALLETSIIMVLLLRRFRIQLKPGICVEPKDAITIPMRNPLLVRLQDRHDYTRKNSTHE